MRPNRLELSAFGPYGDLQIIDFDQLGREGMYLITGDTGAGKTTIFDGIVYALYGEASGTYRDGSMLRSQYASSETKTYVKLDFTYKGELYSIYRNPEYQRRKLKGEGFTKESAYASLKLPTGEEITKVLEVNQRVQELIGLDVQKFKQIGMIAQGDFLKLLLSKTEERSKIFREIFHTDKYRALQEKLREDAKLIADGLKEVDEKISSWFEESLVAGEHQEISEKERLNLLQIRIKDLSNQLENQETLKKTWEKRRIDLSKKQALRKEWERLHLEKLKKEEEISKLNILYKEAKVFYDSLDQAILKEESLSKEVLHLQKDLSSYEQRDKILHEMELLKKEINSLKESPNKISESILLTKEELVKLKEMILGEPNLVEKRLVLEEGIKKLDLTLDQLLLESKKHKFLEALNVDIKEDEKSWQLKSESLQNKQRELSDLEERFWRGQAGIMASHLKEGSPCPVCGSLEHPVKAILREDVPNKELIEQFRKDLDQLKKNFDDLSQSLNQKKAIFKEKKVQIEERLEKIVGPIRYEEIKEKCNEVYLSLMEDKELKQSSYEMILSQQETVQKSKARVSLLEASIQESQERLKRIESLLTQKETQLKSLKDQEEVLTKELKLSSYEQARHMLGQLENEHQTLKASIENTRKKFEKVSNQLNIAKSAHAQLEKSLPREESLPEDEILDKEIGLLENQLQENDASIKNNYLILNKNENIYQNLLEYLRKREEKEKTYQMIVPLAETARAELKGKARIQLETYVQMTYFERIIQRANLRLMKMSGGQYELARREDADSLRAQSGLDLDVLDHYSGKTRSVKSLSGGESFKASLSLALGLSDEIQSSSGGIRLDSMFIDEGFGTLDSESLDQAMKTLASLASHDKLIGIISHVGELKEKIDKKIIVKKEVSGKSHARIIV